MFYGTQGRTVIKKVIIFFGFSLCSSQKILWSNVKVTTEVMICWNYSWSILIFYNRFCCRLHTYIHINVYLCMKFCICACIYMLRSWDDLWFFISGFWLFFILVLGIFNFFSSLCVTLMKLLILLCICWSLNRVGGSGVDLRSKARVIVSLHI